MASRLRLGIRVETARQSIDQSIKTIATKFGIEVPEVLRERAPDAEHAHMLELERIATQISSVTDSLLNVKDSLLVQKAQKQTKK